METTTSGLRSLIHFDRPVSNMKHFVFFAILSISCLPPAIYYRTSDKRFSSVISSERYAIQVNGLDLSLVVYGRANASVSAEFTIHNISSNIILYDPRQLRMAEEGSLFSESFIYVNGRMCRDCMPQKVKRGDALTVMTKGRVRDGLDLTALQSLRIEVGEIDLLDEGEKVQLGTVVFTR